MQTSPAFLPAVVAGWRDLVMPKEHGSWALVFEPLALALLVAPSVGGAWLALALLGVFFARRPLRIAFRRGPIERRQAAASAFLACATVGGGALAASVAANGVPWMLWLLPSAIAGGVFLTFDLQSSGREEVAEIAGALAFALVPAAMAMGAGWTPASAFALAWIMAGRAVPSVMFVRTYLRTRKGAKSACWPALAAGAIAVVGAYCFWRYEMVPLAAAIALLVLFARSAIFLALPRLRMRARTIGFIELGLGLGLIAAAALAWGPSLAR